MIDANLVNKFVMENKRKEILMDIRELISQIRERADLLEEKLAALEGDSGTQPLDAVDIWDENLEFIQPESVEIIREEAEPVPEEKPEVDVEPVLEERQEAVETPAGLFDDDDDLPVTVNQKKIARKSVLDAMENREAWRTDVPGAGVKDVRSAISLNDRILFIRSLFGEDAVAFNDTLDGINSASSFDEAVEAVKSSHPDWKYESETVYRLMMAIRRRFR